MRVRTWPSLIRSWGGSGGMMRTSGWGWMRTRVSFLSVALVISSRMATALSTSSSRLEAEAMRVQLWQTPQKEARDWPLDQRSRGWRSHSTAMASMRAKVYFPAPLGPARVRGGGGGAGGGGGG